LLGSIDHVKPPAFDYFAPKTREETLSLLSEYGEDGRILAGGQSLIPLMVFRMARPAFLIDLNYCPDFQDISVEDGKVVISAMVRQTDAEHSALIAAHCPLLGEALGFAGHPTIRNRGTVVGSLAHADPGAELPTAAMALGAEIVLENITGMRTLSCDEFFVDSLVTAIEPGEMLREVRIPVRRSGDRHAFLESGVRRHDLAVAGVAISINVNDQGHCTNPSVVALGGGGRPMRLTSVEAFLCDQNLQTLSVDELAEAGRDDVEPFDDLQATGAYRRELIVSLTRDALTRVLRP
jgi:carbon-monoxide dehydrogenase medium subunit